MYEPAVNAVEGCSPLDFNSTNPYHATDQLCQPNRIPPPVIHRCISTPYLGTTYNCNSFPEFMPPFVKNQSHNYYQYYLQHEMEDFIQQNDLLSAGIHMKCIPDSSKLGSVPQHMKEIMLSRNAQSNLRSKQVDVGGNLRQHAMLGQYVYQREKDGQRQPAFHDLGTCLQCDTYKEENKLIKLQLETAVQKAEKLELQVNEKECERKKLQWMLHDKHVYSEQSQQKIRDLKKHLELCKTEVIKNGRRDYNQKDSHDLQAENEILISELKHKKEDLDREIASRKSFHKKYQKEIAELKGKLDNETDCVIALTEQIKNKEKKIETLKAQFKECMVQRQSLLEDKQDLEDQLKIQHETSANNLGKKSLQKQLLKELVSTVSQMKDLAEFFVKDYQGDEMNVSLIIGTRAHPVVCPSQDSFPTVDDLLSYQVQEVRKVKDEIARLQDMMSTKYATRIGKQLVL